MTEPHLLLDCRCECGEGPVWDSDRQVLNWLDILKGILFEYDTATGLHREVYRGEVIGGFTLQANGDFLLFETDRLSLLTREGKHRVLLEGIDSDMQRFNDVMADPRGRVYATTIGKEMGKGGLYRIDCEGRIECLFKDTLVANGLTLSPDLSTLYYTDSSHRKIYRFDYNLETGNLSNRTVFHEVTRGEELPDGLTLDSEGCFWSARWDGSAIQRLSPEGEEMERISFPVPQVTSMTFGGPDLDTIYATSAGGSQEDTTGKGALFQFKPGVTGRPEFRSNIDPEVDWEVRL